MKAARSMAHRPWQSQLKDGAAALGRGLAAAGRGILDTLAGLLPARFGLAGAGAERVGRVPVRDWVSVSSGESGRFVGFDASLAWVIVALLCMGLVMVYSATIQLPDSPRYANYAQTHFFLRHLAAMALGLGCAALAFCVPMRKWEEWAPLLFVAALVLLVLVLLPFIGKVVNKSRRWIPLVIINFQPSELAKLAITLYAAN
jgi:cell division protein FtsW